jgi:hypothetical protein
VFHLTGLLEICVELLAMVMPTVLAMLVRVIAAIRLQHVPTLLRQDNGHIAMTVYPLGSDEPFLPEVSEVARPRIGRALVVVPEVVCQDDAKRADGRQRASLRASQGVLAVPGVVDDLAVRSAGQVKVPHEHVPRIEAAVSIARVAIALEPSRVIVAFRRIVLRVLVSRTGRSRAPTQCERVLIVTIARVIISTVTRVIAPSSVIKHRHLRWQF